jgi:hypothetical protein
LPNQVHRKSVRKGFSFTAMVVGQFVPHFDPYASDVLPLVRANRRVRPRKVYVDKHPFQLDSLPAQGALSSCSGASQDGRH